MCCYLIVSLRIESTTFPTLTGPAQWIQCLSYLHSHSPCGNFDSAHGTKRDIANQTIISSKPDWRKLPPAHVSTSLIVFLNESLLLLTFSCLIDRFCFFNTFLLVYDIIFHTCNHITPMDMRRFPPTWVGKNYCLH